MHYSKETLPRLSTSQRTFPKFRKTQSQNLSGSFLVRRRKHLAYIARYIACLQEFVKSLPDRKARRELASDAARAIVILKSPKFESIIRKFSGHWGQTMPKILYTDRATNEFLLKLEDCMLAKYDHSRPSCHLDWRSEETRQGRLPLPIFGLNYTLTFYYPTKPIDLGNITSLYLGGCALTGIPVKRILTQLSLLGSPNFGISGI
jgi:hypothetical protein